MSFDLSVSHFTQGSQTVPLTIEKTTKLIILTDLKNHQLHVNKVKTRGPEITTVWTVFLTDHHYSFSEKGIFEASKIAQKCSFDI